jgi:hypothetical protein
VSSFNQRIQPITKAAYFITLSLAKLGRSPNGNRDEPITALVRNRGAMPRQNDETRI